MVKVAFNSLVKVEFDGDELSSELAPMLVDCWVDQGAGVPAEFRITFRDPYRLIIDELDVKFGTKVVITPVAGGDDSGPLLTGEITGMEADYVGTGTFTVVRGYDFGHRLMRQRRVAAYRNMTASDMTKQIVEQNGVSVGEIGETDKVYEFISQANVTDWDFLSRLAEESGRVMSLDAEGKFQFVEPESASEAPSTGTDGDDDDFVLEAGKDILRMRAAVTAADQVGEVESRGWDVTTKTQLTSVVSAESNEGYEIDTTPGKAAEAFESAKLVETGTPRDQQADVEHAAAAVADDLTSSFVELEVVVYGNPELRPGVPVTLTRVGKPFEGKYTATSVRHVFDGGEHYESWVTVTGRQWRSLYGLASGGGENSGSPRVPSVANAIVTDVLDPLNQGRVKLRFPWLDDDYVSDWVRTVQLGGVNGGSMFPCDVDDEVLVAFDRGALDHPFVIGGLYNGMDLPTGGGEDLYSGAEHKAVRHTLADRGGNRIDLLSDSTTGKEGVRISGGDFLTVNLDRNMVAISIDSDGTVGIKGAAAVDIESFGAVSVSGMASLSLESKGALSLEGSAVNISGAAVNINSATALRLNSTANVGISAATLTVTGMVMVNNKPYPIP